MSKGQESLSYYMRHRTSLLKDFDKVSRHVSEVLESEMSASQVNQIVTLSRKEYDRMIPLIPDIGGKKNPFHFELVGSAWLLALYRTLENRGYELREMGRIGYETMESYVDSIPSLFKFFYRFYVYSRFMKRKMRNAARKSQQREFPSDWVFEFVEGVDGEFEWGADMTERAICKFFKEKDAEKYLPYLCLGDYAMFYSFGVGMKRTKTLGIGQSHCDFRYVKGYKTSRGWPPESLEEFQTKQR
ncbi:MAG: L-2-amino-thiazoline-4-carboxylic acid hydrolase [Candidatus Thorarchaeota archaeon]